MKIEISDNNHNKPKVFSYKEMIEGEGIYQDCDSGDFFIVVGRLVLWCDGKDIEKADSCWRKNKFVKSNKVITLSN